MRATELRLRDVNPWAVERRNYSKVGLCEELQSSFYPRPQSCCAIKTCISLLFRPCSSRRAVATDLQTCTILPTTPQLRFFAGGDRHIPWDNATRGPAGDHKQTSNYASRKGFPPTSISLDQLGCYTASCSGQETWYSEHGRSATV